jgi:transposase
MRPAQVAVSVGVTRQTVYNWADRFDAGGVRGLVDRPRRGRPSKLSPPVRRFLEWSVQQPPDEMGYPSVSWTVPLLREHLRRWAGVRVSGVTVRRVLHRLGYVWKRPRYVLQPDPERARKKA